MDYEGKCFESGDSQVLVVKQYGNVLVCVGYSAYHDLYNVKMWSVDELEEFHVEIDYTPFELESGQITEQSAEDF